MTSKRGKEGTMFEAMAVEKITTANQLEGRARQGKKL